METYRLEFIRAIIKKNLTPIENVWINYLIPTLN